MQNPKLRSMEKKNELLSMDRVFEQKVFAEMIISRKVDLVNEKFKIYFRVE
mgnify:CR=1 FL=1